MPLLPALPLPLAVSALPSPRVSASVAPVADSVTVVLPLLLALLPEVLATPSRRAHVSVATVADSPTRPRL